MMGPMAPTGTVRWEPRCVRTINNGQWYRTLSEPRAGVMIHYDASSSDAGSLSWFAHDQCRVSYQVVVLDDGTWARIAPDTAGAWHAGRCRPSDERLRYRSANHAFYGIAAATNDRVDVTPVQLLTIAWHVRRWFEAEGWPVEQLWRVTGHEDEAYPRGRKSDPSGGDPLNPIFSVSQVQQLVPLIQPSGD